MKRTNVVAVLLGALALTGLAAPVAEAQAPAPKVTINGLIDNVTSASWNVHNNSGMFNREDQQWYARTRGRFDVIGEIGKAKGVLGLEIDSTWGQTGSADTANAGGFQQFGTTSSFDLNTDTNPSIEVKWLYTEFPLPFMPVPTTVTLGAQPSGAAASYKLATYFNGDYAGVHTRFQVTPNVRLMATYVAVEEGLTGTETKNNTSFSAGTLQSGTTQDRGDDLAWILSAEITPFKGLDIKPLFSGFFAQGTTSSNARAGRGGVNTTTSFSGCATPPSSTCSTTVSARGGLTETRYTVGLDARYRMGPFSLDPSVLYQFGYRNVQANVTGNSTIDTNAAAAGVVAGRKYHADISAWLFDIRAGYQLGPLLIQGLGVYSTGNSARSTTLNNVNYFQPLNTDTSYLGDWGTQLTSLGLDYLSALNEAGRAIAYTGSHIGWDKYGRGQLGVKATYAITPALSAMAGVNWHWTAEAVDRNGIPVAGAGLVPAFTTAQVQQSNRDRSSFIGTEIMALISWRLTDGISWDNSFGYMWAGKALDAFTDNAYPSAPGYGRHAEDSAIITSRVRLTF